MTTESLGEAAARVVARLASGLAEPGFYDIPAAAYHADPCVAPSLSSSVAETLLAATPLHAWEAHPRLNPGHESRSSAAMDLGSVAHEIALGKGGGFVISPFDTYTTKDARAWRDETIAAGRIPIKAVDHDAACRMATNIRRILDETPGAERAFLDGHAEVVLLWRDIGGPWCRAMLDWLMPDPTIFDLKTTSTGLSDRAISARIGDGWDQKAAFHLRGLEQLRPEIAGRAKWRWVVAETKPPFEARVVELDGAARTMGDKKAAFAIELWRRCLETNRWPGYPRRIERLEYPIWAESQWLAREEADDVALSAQPMHRIIERPSKPLLGAI